MTRRVLQSVINVGDNGEITNIVDLIEFSYFSHTASSKVCTRLCTQLIKYPIECCAL